MANVMQKHDNMTSLHGMQVHGKYWAHNRAAKPARQAQDDAVSRRLWEVSCKLTDFTPVAL